MASGKVWSQRLPTFSKYQPRGRMLAFDDGGQKGKKLNKAELIGLMARRAAFQIANETLSTKTIKNCDTSFTTSGATQTWQTDGANIMTIKQDKDGAPTANSRVGQKIRVKQFIVNYQISTNPYTATAATAYSQFVTRVIIFLDKSPNGAITPVNGTSAGGGGLLEFNGLAVGAYNENAQYYLS